MTPLEAADLAVVIGKTERWVKRHARTLPHHKFGRSYVFTPEDVAAILESHAHRPAPAEVAAADLLRPVRARRAS